MTTRSEPLGPRRLSILSTTSSNRLAMYRREAGEPSERATTRIGSTRGPTSSHWRSQSERLPVGDRSPRSAARPAWNAEDDHEA